MNRQQPVALITGAARGIGAAVADRLASQDYRLILLDRDIDTLDTFVRALPANAQTLTSAVDVRDAAQLNEAVAAGAHRFGGLDAVVTCAGINASFDAVALSETDWDSVFSIDLKSTWLTCRAALPHLLDSARAAIVTISSIHAQLTDAGTFPYAAAKAGVEGLTRSLALDYGPRGVRVNAVAPAGRAPESSTTGFPGRSGQTTQWPPSTRRILSAASPSRPRSRTWSRFSPASRPAP